ncbi:hypothetical protein C4J81_12535 [Deltaproteobacteria bacterium Smac51]|nr:hypothetical protein C4J81_12535 [Deltaproteobacteria bacterium Smac51]
MTATELAEGTGEAMNTILIDLKNLQEVDDQLKACREAAAAAAARMEEARLGLKGFEDRLTQVKGELDKMRSRHQELEVEVSQLSVKRDNNLKRQGAVKNNNEFTALAKEAEYISGRINDVEDEILELLDRIEKAEAQKADLEIVVTEETAAYGRTASEIESSVKAGNEAQAGLLSARQTLVESLPADKLRQYDELIKIRAGRAVTPAAEGMCQACRLGFPPQLFNELQRNEKINTCPNCSRILYWRDHPDYVRGPHGTTSG